MADTTNDKLDGAMRNLERELIEQGIPVNVALKFQESCRRMQEAVAAAQAEADLLIKNLVQDGMPRTEGNNLRGYANHAIKNYYLDGLG